MCRHRTVKVAESETQDFLNKTYTQTSGRCAEGTMAEEGHQSEGQGPNVEAESSTNSQRHHHTFPTRGVEAESSPVTCTPSPPLESTTF